MPSTMEWYDNARRFDFPVDNVAGAGTCPAADQDPFNPNASPCHHVDYVTRPLDCKGLCPAISLVGKSSITLKFTILQGWSPVFSCDTQYGSGYPCTAAPGSGPSLFLFFEVAGDQSLTNPAGRWWSAAYVPVAVGTNTITVPLQFSAWGCVEGACTEAQFQSAIANAQNVGFTFGGGSIGKGHGNFIDGNLGEQIHPGQPGSAAFVINSFSVQ